MLRRVPRAVEDDFSGVAFATPYDIRTLDVSTRHNHQRIACEAFCRKFRLDLRLQLLARFEGTPRGGS